MSTTSNPLQDNIVDTGVVQIKIEYRLWSHVSMNWKGHPLTSHDVIIDLIAATTTRAGLKVEAGVDQSCYPVVSRSPTSS